MYRDEPTKYEVLSIVSIPITPEIKWDERGEANLAFDRLRAAAAKVGANGLLLALNTKEYDAVVRASYHGESYSVPMKNRPKTILGAAIYVYKE